LEKKEKWGIAVIAVIARNRHHRAPDFLEASQKIKSAK
jgi:hypothetical protein